MKAALYTVVLVFSVFTVNANSSVSCPSSGRHILPLSDCTKFLTCDEGEGYEMTCPASLYFNPSNFQCDFDFNVPECQGGTRGPVAPTSGPTSTTASSSTSSSTTASTTTSTSTTTILPTTEKSTTTVAPPPNQCPKLGMALIPHPDDCSKYFMCINGEQFQYQCGNGRLYHHILRECRPTSEVDCTRT